MTPPASAPPTHARRQRPALGKAGVDPRRRALPLLWTTAGGPGGRRLRLGRLGALPHVFTGILRGRQFSFLAAVERVTGSVRARGSGAWRARRMQMALES